MSSLSDAFIATDAELATTPFEGVARPVRFFPTLPSEDIDPVRLSLLEAIVTGQSLDTETVVGLTGVPVKEGENWWVFRFSEALAGKLVGLTPGEIERFSAQWASQQESWCVIRETPPHPEVDVEYFASAKRYFQELCQLAIQAQAEGKHMYMWMCI